MKEGGIESLPLGSVHSTGEINYIMKKNIYKRVDKGTVG